VSRPWRDEVAIYLAPRRLALVRRGGLRRRVLAAAEVPVPAGPAADLGPLFTRLGEVLADSTWHRASVRAVVADHPWARYVVVPWLDSRLGASARLAHARYLLGDTYGDAVADWAVTLSEAPPGRSCVACAMPPGLRSSLEDALAPAELALLSLRPRLVVAFNAWRRHLPANDAWFVSLDDGSLSAVHLRQGAWDRVHMARLSPDWALELERLQAFARLTRDAKGSGRMFVDGPAWMRRKVGGSNGLEWLTEGEGDEEPGTPGGELALLRRVNA